MGALQCLLLFRGQLALLCLVLLLLLLLGELLGPCLVIALKELLCPGLICSCRLRLLMLRLEI